MTFRFEELADALDELALHYRLEGMDHIALQYTKASSELRKADFLPANPAEIPHVGESIRDDIAEYRARGEIPRLEDLREKRPYLSPLCEVKSIGPTRAKTLYEEKGVESIADLAELAKKGELEECSGIGPNTARSIKRSVSQMNYE